MSRVSSPEFVAGDNWSVSRIPQQIEVDEKGLMSKIRADESGWTFGRSRESSQPNWGREPEEAPLEGGS